MALLKKSAAKGEGPTLRLVGRGTDTASAAPASEALVTTTIVHPNPEDERVVLLAKLLRRLGYGVAQAPNISAVRRSRTAGAGPREAVIVADEKADATLAEEAVALAESAGTGVSVIYVADTMPAEGYKRLVRTGAGEWIQWRALPREIGDVLRGLESAARAPTPHEAALIVSFLPSKGGVGNTTLVVETAVQMAARTKALRGRIAIVDMNFDGGTLGDVLDVESRFDIGEILQRPERLDAQLVDIFSSKHAAQIDVFSCPPRYGERLDVPAEVVFSLLDQVGAKYDLVLLDLPSVWHPWIDNVLLGSSAVVVTGESTVPGVRQLASTLKHLSSIEIPRERAVVAVNRCRVGLLGRVARQTDIAAALKGQSIVYVAADETAASEAANTGRPMAQTAPRRAVSRTIRQIATWIESIRKPS